MSWSDEQMARLREYRTAMDTAGNEMTDQQVLDTKEIHRAWRVGESVSIGNVRQYNKNLYRCKLAHTTQADWTPDIVANLWNRITAQDEWPQWTSGTWAKGAKVIHKDKKWVSQVDNNGWEPGAPGVYENIWKQWVS